MTRFLVVLAALAALAPPAAVAAQDAPERLPLSAYVDSAALHRALLAAPARPADFARKPVLMVLYDSTGAVSEVNAWYRRRYPAYADSMERLVRPHLKPLAPSRPLHGEDLWIEGGPNPVIRLAPSVVTARPRLANTTQIRAELARAVRQMQSVFPSFAGQSVTATISTVVDEEGVPAAPILWRGTGYLAIDHQMVEVARKMRFRPALVDGEPVRVMVSVPINMTFPRSAPDPTAQP